jgi:NAD(P)-dependent dehydrogenase (short-subunit alcohol dehydrogenase family)
MGSLTEKVAVVTGGGLRLGEAIGKSLATKGAMVVLTDINPDDATRVTKEIADAGGVTSAIAQNVFKPEQSENVVRYPRLDNFENCVPSLGTSVSTRIHTNSSLGCRSASGIFCASEPV